ncbi:MAG: hypothetical protein ACI9QA_000866 [Methanobacteriota archaeon]|jgi:hypothetical protein|uniref:Uncharacterized protein n=1 Tax=Halorutilus salinus TaxID=2487751 RepID=A0A9Q4GI62_9EURY|nr:hypothetical protein [Halorutilus salinus]MCX2819530.1 hypothetical protein [Halorutilus salinus]
MTDETLELFAERTYRLIVRLDSVGVDAVENAVTEVFDADFEDIDVAEFAPGASHAEFEGTYEGNEVQGTVSENLDGNAVLTLQDIVYVDGAAERLEALNDLLRDETLADTADRLREHDADENPLERVL